MKPRKSGKVAPSQTPPAQEATYTIGYEAVVVSDAQVFEDAHNESCEGEVK